MEALGNPALVLWSPWLLLLELEGRPGIAELEELELDGRLLLDEDWLELGILGMLGMLLELDELDDDGIEGMLALDELWLEVSQASSRPLRLTNSTPLPRDGKNRAPRAVAPAGNLFILCLAVIILSLWSGADCCNTPDF